MRRRLHIAMVAACPFPAPRGTPVRIFRMAEALGRRRHCVHVVTYHLGAALGVPPFTVHRTPRLPTYRKESPGPSAQKLGVMDPLLAWRLAEVLRRHPIDLVHAHHYEGLLVARAVACWTGHPVVYDAHTLLESELSHYLPRPLRGAATWIGARLDARLPRNASHVIAVSDAIRTRYLETRAMRPDRITVVPNGVELAHFEGTGGGAAGAARETLIFTGNLAPYQGIELLLRSFREIHVRRRLARLLLVCEGTFEPYESLAAELGIRDAIELVPASFATLPDQLARAAVALNPRVQCHGTPVKVLNYMAAAKPIVSFAGSAHVLRHGQTAWVVPDGDVTAFADGVLRLLDDPALAGRLGAAARAQSRSEFSWDRAARKVERVYAGVLGRQPRQRGGGAAPALRRVVPNGCEV